MDFVHDQLVTGTKIRVLTIVDTFSRYAAAIMPQLRFWPPDVVEALERVGAQIGLPQTIRVDEGGEFVSRDSISGPNSGASRSISPGPESPPTMPSSKA